MATNLLNCLSSTPHVENCGKAGCGGVSLQRHTLYVFPEGFNVGQILQPTCGTLVCDEGFTPEKGDRVTADLALCAGRPCLLEVLDSRDSCEDVDSVWRQPQLHNRFRPEEVVAVDLKIVEGRTEACQRLPHPLHVLRGGLDPDIEILGSPWDAVHGKGMSADDEEAGTRIEQGDEDVLPVLRHPGRITLIGIRPREYDGTDRPVSLQARSLNSRSTSTRSSAVVVADRSSRGSSPSRKTLATAPVPPGLDASVDILESNARWTINGRNYAKSYVATHPLVAQGR